MAVKGVDLMSTLSAGTHEVVGASPDPIGENLVALQQQEHDDAPLSLNIIISLNCIILARELYYNPPLTEDKLCNRRCVVEWGEVNHDSSHHREV